MSDITPIEIAEMLSKEAHQVYLDTWETKTRFAERDCKWDDDIQHRNHLAIEKLSSTVDLLAHQLGEALKRIETLETELKKPE